MKKSNATRLLTLITIILVMVSSLGACKNKETTIRVMSYNILHPNWCSTEEFVNVYDRDNIVTDIFNDYMPDVVGLQETSSVWHSALESILADEGVYDFACRNTKEGKRNLTTFIYNTKKLKLVDEYVIDLYEVSDIRVLSVAVFETLDSKEQFVVTNTHPDVASREDAYKCDMYYLTKYAKQELEKYKDLPVILTGDFNTTEQSEYYTNFMTDTGVKDVKYEAETMAKNYNTFSGLRKPPKEGNTGCIDHIFVNDNVTVKLYDVVTDHNVENASDHIPIYADIVISK